MKRISALLLSMLLLLTLAGCGQTKKTETMTGLGNGTEPVRHMELQFAKEFSVDYYEDGCKLITVQDDGRFLVVPEGVAVPTGIHSDIVVLQQPLQNIYLVAAAAMSLIDSLGGLDSIGLSGTQADKWDSENARLAMEEGRIRFAGKYSEPDYELIVSSHCALSIQSTMIYHQPAVREKLESLGVPVFVERSGRESDPLARTEWIKVYGVLLDKEDEAQRLFDEQAAKMQEAEQSEATGKTVAFFYISTSGYAVVRKPGDYIAKMIELAGGQYIFSDAGEDTDGSTTSMDMETFYQTAKDADFIIYNATIAGEVHTVDELIARSELLADFKAVKDGNVWCSDQNVYQNTMQLGSMVLEINHLLTGSDPTSLRFFYKLT
ncbi:MAG: ABC transporter substrate-binding protein [Clostridiales bacterium]|nr:ABC transporter substrate-binding protein [Clostridiales bacterium]